MGRSDQPFKGIVFMIIFIIKSNYLQLRNSTSLHPGTPSTNMQWGFHPHVSYLKTVFGCSEPGSTLFLHWKGKDRRPEHAIKRFYGPLYVMGCNRKQRQSQGTLFHLSMLCKLTIYIGVGLAHHSFLNCQFKTLKMRKSHLLSRPVLGRWPGCLAWFLDIFHPQLIFVLKFLILVISICLSLIA